MLKYCLKMWDKNRDKLQKDIESDTKLNSCDYKYLVEKVISIVFNDEDADYDHKWDAENIMEIDNGDYQGTMLFIIPKDTYKPNEADYLITFVNYGSCSCCDTLLSIQDWEENPKPAKEQIKDYMTLCKDLVCNIVKPYNSGWRNEEEFEQVEMEVKNE